MEEDVPNDEMDVLDLNEQETWPGIWVAEPFLTFTFEENDCVKFTLNRYLPKWTWDRFEQYSNDYRWSPGSPTLDIKGFRRYYNVTSINLDKIDIHWLDLGSYTIEKNAAWLSAGLLTLLTAA